VAWKFTFSVGDSAVAVDYYSDQCLAFVIYTSCIRLDSALFTVIVLSLYSLHAVKSEIFIFTTVKIQLTKKVPRCLCGF
jgi:hypothetical protein